MECNRDDALRAKEIAEEKFTAQDIVGAKKFALKAQRLYPELEGISQMIATLDVYLSADVKPNGERDWYATLCVNASADEETVKKQYRKLALQLHPDKNKSIGAEGAFKLISEAWSVLSDKSRKMVYDQKRNIKGFQQRPPQPNRDQSVPNTASGLTNKATSNARAQKSTTVPAPSAVPAPSVVPPPSRPSKSHSFWTSCNRCKMQYEYLRVYLNHNLLCPSCHEPFVAVEIKIPNNGPNSSVPRAAPQQHQQNSYHHSPTKKTHASGKNASTVPGIGSTGVHHGANLDPFNKPNIQCGPFSRTAGAAGVTATTSAATQAANIIHQTNEKIRREAAEALRRKNHLLNTTPGSGNSNAGFTGNMPDRERPTLPKVDRPVKKRRGINDGTIGYGGDETEPMGTGTGKTGEGIASGFKVPTANKCFNSSMGVSGDSGKARMTARQNYLSREFSQMDIRNILMEKARVVIRKKLEERNAAAAAKCEEKAKAKKKQKQKGDDKEKVVVAAVHGDAIDQKKLDDSRDSSKQVPGERENSNDSGADSDKNATEPVSIDVPDPDFHDFDKDRSERSFVADQVWATYDDEDGMPRFYALVQKVISLKPFKIKISYLNSKSNSELGPLNWVASGFAKTCGDFRVGKYEANDTVNIFSHRVRWEKGLHGVIRIYPRRGDTWAIYRNWSPDWNEHTPDDVIYKYDMVEVLDDYNEEQGVSVTPLVKVAGFKTVFHQHLDPKEVKRIPREEMFRFSHQVPSYLLTGEEAPNAPKGCRELDPAATPLELLKVITEAKEDEEMDTVEQQTVS